MKYIRKKTSKNKLKVRIEIRMHAIETARVIKPLNNKNKNKNKNSVYR